MTKEFVPYELALKLKQLGFDEPCFANYTVIPEDKIDWFTIPEQGITDKTSFGSSKNYNSKSFEEEGTISSPTYSQAFRWFREKHGMVFNLVGSGPYYPSIAFILIDGNSDIELGEYDNYEEAELACLDKLIEIVESKI